MRLMALLTSMKRRAHRESGTYHGTASREEPLLPASRPAIGRRAYPRDPIGTIGRPTFVREVKVSSSEVRGSCPGESAGLQELPTVHGGLRRRPFDRLVQSHSSRTIGRSRRPVPLPCNPPRQRTAGVSLYRSFPVAIPRRERLRSRRSSRQK